MTVAIPADAKPNLTPHEAARRYAELGLRVAPIIPGKKHPGLDRWQEAATTDLAILDAWWEGLYAGHGVCIVTGGHIFGLDVDPAHGGIDTLTDLEDAYGPLPRTWTVTTGSGGAHFYFRATRPPRNSASSRLGPGLDIRGDGGQLVAPPTIHPNGQPYSWETAPWDVELADAPGWLLALLSDPLPSRTMPGPTTDEDSIAAHINQETTWDDLLFRDGWTPGQWRGQERPWRRPGKGGPGGWSAIEHGDSGVLCVWSTSVPTLQRTWADKGSLWAYNRFGYIAATKYDGDRSMAAREARRDLNATRPTTGIALGTSPAVPTADQVEDEPHGWEVHDLSGIAAGTFTRPQPTLLRRTK